MRPAALLLLLVLGSDAALPHPVNKPTPPIDLEARLEGDPAGAFTIIARAGSALEADGTGTVLYSSSGTVDGVRDRFVEALADRGFTADADLASGDPERATLPFGRTRGDQDGVLTVHRDVGGRVRVAVTYQ